MRKLGVVVVAMVLACKFNSKELVAVWDPWDGANYNVGANVYR